jgi:hypothetical protein
VLGYAAARVTPSPGTPGTDPGHQWLEIREMVIAAGADRHRVGSRLLGVLAPLAGSGRTWTSLQRPDRSAISLFELVGWTAVTRTGPVVMLGP